MLDSILSASSRWGEVDIILLDRTSNDCPLLAGMAFISEVHDGRDYRRQMGRSGCAPRSSRAGVRVVVFNEGEKATADAWLKAFHDWVDSHEPVGHFVDDSRESIYCGTIDDPR